MLVSKWTIHGCCGILSPSRLSVSWRLPWQTLLLCGHAFPRLWIWSLGYHAARKNGCKSSSVFPDIVCKAATLQVLKATANGPWLLSDRFCRDSTTVRHRLESLAYMRLMSHKPHMGKRSSLYIMCLSSLLLQGVDATVLFVARAKGLILIHGASTQHQKARLPLWLSRIPWESCSPTTVVSLGFLL